MKNLHVLKCKNVMSRSEENTLPEVKNLHTNNNNINNTELSNTESNHIISEMMGWDSMWKHTRKRSKRILSWLFF